jgi:tricorn protease-like protein
LLDVRFDDLKQRDQAQKQKRLVIVSAFSFALVAVMAGLTFWAFDQQQEAERQKATALKSQHEAKIAEEVAVKAQKEAEWESYVNQIALADAKIKEGDIAKAEKLLWDTKQEYRNWEWGRLMMTADLSLLTFKVGSGRAESAVFSPKGQHALTGAWRGSVRIRDTTTGKIWKEFTGHKGKMSKVAYSPDGKKIISAGEDGTVRIWEVKSEKELHLLEGYGKGEGDIAFSPDGKLVASAGVDGSVIFWDVESGKELQKMEFKQLKVFSLAFSPDGENLVTTHNQGTVYITDLRTQVRRKVKLHSGGVRTSSFSPDGKKLWGCPS